MTIFMRKRRTTWILWVASRQVRRRSSDRGGRMWEVMVVMVAVKVVMAMMHSEKYKKLTRKQVVLLG